MSVDPLADMYPGWSPYNYALNNSFKYIDPDGMSARGLAGEGMRVAARHRYPIVGGNRDEDEDDKSQKEGKKNNQNAQGQSATLTILGVGGGLIANKFTYEFWMSFELLGYNRKALTTFGALSTFGQVLGTGAFGISVALDYNNWQNGKISGLDFGINAGIGGLSLFSIGFGTLGYTWYKSLPQFHIQQKQAIEAQKQFNYPILPKFGF